ncbi:uncharacterized protein LOC124141090 [Haliotis rufescens]|uniref:uncharacterized protein LOC124141090 n=1 Tax=Haliotis rufescens TaxID=6454 RepID=UPI00201F0F9D|nr:uncharacterized protein LOC124141090 [Haliotis rufescens]XP_046364943.2 uncharacterized protein LOC124141090 [Haliotis rufescens]
MMPWSCGGWQLPNNMDDLDLRHIQGEALQIPIRCLPQSCRKFLSDVLDPESTLGRSDYRRFAELLGLSHFQTEGCRARNRDRSITGILLTEFGHQPIWRLLTILREMDVAGVREILNSWQEIRGNYHTEQSQLAGGYQGGVQNTESLCTCMNCPAFPSHQNRDTWGYPYIPPYPQDESCHIRGQARQSVMHTPPSQQAWQQPRTSPEGLKGGEGQEDARGKMAGQDAGMKGMQEARPGAMRNITELTQTGPDRCNEKLFLANNQWCRDNRQGSLQRMMSNEDNCSYGIESGADEPINAGIRNNGLGDGNSTQNNGLADGNSTQNNGTGNANSTQNNGLADGNSTQNNGTGNANSTQNNGLGDCNSTQNNGTGDGNSTQYNGTCTNLLLNQGDHNSQEELSLTQNGPGNSLSIPDNNDWLPPAEWDSISTSVKTFQNKASKASRQSPMAHDIARNEHSSSTPQMANRNNGKPVTLYPSSADKSEPQKSSICPSTYPNYMPTDTRGHAYSSPTYAYSEFGNPDDEHYPSHQTLQKGYLYQYNGAPRTYHGPLETYHRAPQPIQGVPQIFQGAPQTHQRFPQTIQGVPSNNQCVPQPIQGGQFQMVSQIPHRYNMRSPPQHATGRGSHFVQQRGLDARNWQVPHTSEIPTATQTHPVASQLYQYLHDVPAAAVPVPRGHSNRQSDRPPQVEDGPGFSEKDQVKLRGQDLRQGTEKRLSDPAVREEVIPVCQHRRHGSDEGGAVYGREAESGHRGREKYVFITGGDMENQEAVAKEMEKICHELHKHSITAVADLPNKVKAVPRDPLQGSNSLSFRRDNIHEARMAYFERATCVLMIVSPGYKEYVDKDNDQAQARPSEHQSSTRHIYTLMLTEYCEKNFSKNKRFYPVCLAKLKTKRSDIPDWITSTLTYCFPGKELFQHLKQDLENN